MKVPSSFFSDTFRTSVDCKYPFLQESKEKKGKKVQPMTDI